jgi:HAD superfamily hydrolase (TIGR01490 family)
VSLAIFDLDETLLAGDSDYLWGKFLVDEGVVDREHYEKENERFFRQYKEGCLNIREWLAFQLRPLVDNEPDTLHQLRARFLKEQIEPIVLPKGRELVESHRARGHELLIITATNSFITRPIADMLGIGELLACEVECVDGRYTGNIVGIPSFREGKVLRLKAWLETRRHDLTASWFYSDSHNDLPLLELVSNPVAVDPDPILSRIASERGWPIISLR